MQLEDIRHSSFSAATKSKMLLDLWIQLYRQPARPKSSDRSLENLGVYHTYYEALAIVENLDRLGQKISPELAEEKDLYLYRSTAFTAWLIGGHFDPPLNDPEMIVQMDDCRIETLLDSAILPHCYATDKCFKRWWVYPRNLIRDQKPPNPITEDFLMNLMPSPVNFESDLLLSILQYSNSTSWLARETEYWLKRKVEANAMNPRPRIS
jgi:hypothetical protein